MATSSLRWTKEEMEKLAQATAATLRSDAGDGLSFKHAAERSQGVLAKDRQRAEIISSTTLSSLKRRVKQLNSNKEGARNASHSPSTSSKGNSEDAKLAYALGHVQSWIETYARSSGLSSTSLAYRLGKLLQRSARR